MAITGAMGAPHLNATKDQRVQLADFNPGGVQVRKPMLALAHEGGQAARKPFKTGQLRDSARRSKHRASRRAGTL